MLGERERESKRDRGRKAHREREGETKEGNPIQ